MFPNFNRYRKKIEFYKLVKFYSLEIDEHVAQAKLYKCRKKSFH